MHHSGAVATAPLPLGDVDHLDMHVTEVRDIINAAGILAIIKSVQRPIRLVVMGATLLSLKAQRLDQLVIAHPLFRPSEASSPMCVRTHRSHRFQRLVHCETSYDDDCTRLQVWRSASVNHGPEEAA